MVLLRILPDVTGSGKSKMAAVKQEIFISPLLDKIATKFQRLPQVFAVQEHKYINTNIDRCMKMSQIQDGGRKTGSVCMSFQKHYTYTHISTSRRDSNEIPKATPCCLSPGTKWR